MVDSTALTVQFPPYLTCQCNKHESRYNLNNVQIYLRVWRLPTHYKKLTFILSWGA